MRDLKTKINGLIPHHENEWDARLFIDEAVKTSAENYLQSIAMALCGNDDIRVEFNNEIGFEKTDHLYGDDGNWITITKKYCYRATFDRWNFWANKKIGLWIQIIDFYAHKESVFPCGAASFPNSNWEHKYKPDEEKKEVERQKEIESLKKEIEFLKMFAPSGIKQSDNQK